MYALREDAVRKLLRIDFSGRVITDEALRAMAQAFTLTEATDIRAVRCDVSDITRGPGGLLLIAAALAMRFRPGLRVALLAEAPQLPFVSRLIRFSGVSDSVVVFESVTEADAWLMAVLPRPGGRLSGTARRHANQVLASGRRQSVVVEAGERRGAA
jgi:hypothetical protein